MVHYNTSVCTAWSWATAQGFSLYLSDTNVWLDCRSNISLLDASTNFFLIPLPYIFLIRLLLQLIISGNLHLLIAKLHIFRDIHSKKTLISKCGMSFPTVCTYSILDTWCIVYLLHSIVHIMGQLRSSHRASELGTTDFSGIQCFGQLGSNWCIDVQSIPSWYRWRSLFILNS